MRSLALICGALLALVQLLQTLLLGRAKQLRLINRTAWSSVFVCFWSLRLLLLDTYDVPLLIFFCDNKASYHQGNQHERLPCYGCLASFPLDVVDFHIGEFESHI